MYPQRGKVTTTNTTRGITAAVALHLSVEDELADVHVPIGLLVVVVVINVLLPSVDCVYKQQKTARVVQACAMRSASPQHLKSRQTKANGEALRLRSASLSLPKRKAPINDDHRTWPIDSGENDEETLAPTAGCRTSYIGENRKHPEHSKKVETKKLTGQHARALGSTFSKKKKRTETKWRKQTLRSLCPQRPLLSNSLRQ